MKLVTTNRSSEYGGAYLSLEDGGEPYLRVATTTAATPERAAGGLFYLGVVEGAALRKLGEAIVRATKPRRPRKGTR